MTDLPRLGEDELIALAERFFGPTPPGVTVGIGDDAAVVDGPDGRAWLWTTDLLIEDVHYRPAWTDAHRLGRKSISVNASDIAAMGGLPRFALVSVALPRGADPAWVRDLVAGLGEAADEYGLSIIGGDTTASPGPVMISITVWGQAEADRVLYRSGGRAGDLLLVSRPLGAAGAAVALLEAGETPPPDLLAALNDPLAEIDLAPQIAQTGLASAMMDLSDGLLRDAARLAQASGLAAVIDPDAVPLAEGVSQAASRLGQNRLKWPLDLGEDYALLVACPAERAADLNQTLTTGLHRELYLVGRLEEGVGLYLDGEAGRESVEPEGYEHFV